MTKVVLHQPFDISRVRLTNFLGGAVDTATATDTRLTIDKGKYEAIVTGEDLDPSAPSGIVHTVEGLIRNRPIFTLDKMDVDFADVRQLDDDGLLKELFFGGADTFKGSKGADLLWGAGGDDFLIGRKGDDELHGVGGADTLVGGAGTDSFYWVAQWMSSIEEPDLILDLDEASDFINLFSIDVQGEAWSTYDEPRDVTTFWVDVDGDTFADMAIEAAGDHRGFEASGRFLYDDAF